MYLDYVDFGNRRVPDSIPRIFVWKGLMIKTYSELDLKSPGCYGFRPLLDFSQTCYSKSIHMLQSNSDSSFVDAEFLDMIDSHVVLYLLM